MLIYTTITIFYVFVLTPEAPLSLYDACDLTYSCTNRPRTLETEHATDNRTNFEPPWWSYEKFYASFVVQTVFFLFLRYYLFPASCFIANTSRLLRCRSSRRSIATMKHEDGEDATKKTKFVSEGSSGSLSSVMRYLLGDSKMSRRNPFSGSLERTVRNVIARINRTNDQSVPNSL